VRCCELLWAVVGCCELLWAVVSCCELLWAVVRCCEPLWVVVSCCEVLWAVVSCCELLWVVVSCCELLWAVVKCCVLLWAVVSCCELKQTICSEVRLYLYEIVIAICLKIMADEICRSWVQCHSFEHTWLYASPAQYLVEFFRVWSLMKPTLLQQQRKLSSDSLQDCGYTFVCTSVSEVFMN
jgi:hypothetical protein